MFRRGQRMAEICSDEDDRVDKNIVSAPFRINSKRLIDEEEQRIRIARGEEEEEEEAKAKAVASKNSKNKDKNRGDLRKGRARHRRPRRELSPSSNESSSNESSSNYTEEAPGAFHVTPNLRDSHASAGARSAVPRAQHREVEGEEDTPSSSAYLPDDPILEATKVEEGNDIEYGNTNNNVGIVPAATAERDTALAFLKRSRCLQMTLFFGCFVIVGLVLGVSLALFNKAIKTETSTEPPEDDEFFHQVGSSIDGPIEDGRFGLTLTLKGDSTNGYKMAVADIQEVFVYELQQQQQQQQMKEDNTSSSSSDNTLSLSSSSFDWNLTATIEFPSNATAGRRDIQFKNNHDVVLNAVNVYMSQDGNHLAIGWPYSSTKDGSKLYAGCVKVYRYLADDKRWEQYGPALYGMSSADFFGASVTLNANGQYLGVGSPGNMSSAHVFQFVDGNWTRHGNFGRVLDGTLAVGSISMSSTGMRVAVGGCASPIRGGGEEESAVSRTTTTTAVVRIFSFISGDWIELGQGIAGYSESGTAYTTELSAATGDVVALSNYYLGESSPAENERNDALDVRIYKWEKDDGDWVQLGGNIHASEPGEKSGYFISLSDDGKLIFMGDPGRRSEEGGGEAGHVHMYRYNSELEDFEQVGPNREGDSAGDNFGTAVAMSGDGKVFAASAPYNRGSGKELGRIYAFSIDDGAINE